MMKTHHVMLVSALCLAMLGFSGGKKDFVDRMAAEHGHDVPVANASTVALTSDNVTAEDVVYATVNGTDVTGYLAQPHDADDARDADDVKGDLPGVIVIHEWWGLNDNIRMMTRRLAAQGYKALAVDLYHGESAETPDKAAMLMRAVEEGPAIENLRQAYRYLTEKQGVTGVGTIGWCFGGGWSLQAALAMPDKVDATVIYYGRLVTDADRLASLDMPVLGIFGSEDRGIPPSTVRAFEAALNEAGVHNSIHIYEGANHAFANPSGTRYNQKAAEDAWAKTVAFFAAHLKAR